MIMDASLAIPAPHDDDGDDDGDGEKEDPLEDLAAFLASEPDPESLLAKIDELDIKPHVAITVVVQSIFDERIVQQLATNLGLLKKLCINEKCQKGLIGGLERLVGITFPGLQKKFPFLLQQLYEHDLLDEDTILHWFSHPSRKYVGSRRIAESIRECAEPFIDWLKNADEDDG